MTAEDDPRLEGACGGVYWVLEKSPFSEFRRRVNGLQISPFSGCFFGSDGRGWGGYLGDARGTTPSAVNVVGDGPRESRERVMRPSEKKLKTRRKWSVLRRGQTVEKERQRERDVTDVNDRVTNIVP